MDETIEKAYNCKGHCDNQELAYIQWVSQNVTLHPPEEIKEYATDTISNWFPDLYPIPIEFGYYSNKSGCSLENCNSISINNTILLGNHSDNLKITNEKSFYISNIFKKMHTLYLNGNQQNEFTKIFGIENSKEFFKVFDYYTDNEIFGNLFKIYNNPVDILTGYSSEDSKGMQYLAKGGNYYDNFKPNISKVTGSQHHAQS